MSYVLLITDSLELSTQEFDIGTPAINKIVHITHTETVVSSLYVEHVFSWISLDQSEKHYKKLY